MTRRAGMTITEALVGGLLGALILGALVAFFQSALRITQRSVARSRLHQTGVTAMIRLIQDLQEANAGGLTFLDQPEGVMRHCLIHPIDDVSADGLPVYSDRRLFHWTLDGPQQILCRRSFDNIRRSPLRLRSGEPMRFLPAQVDLMLKASAYNKRFQEVKLFDISTPGVERAFVGNPLRLRIVLECQVGAGQAPEVAEISRSVVLRNSL